MILLIIKKKEHDKDECDLDGTEHFEAFDNVQAAIKDKNMRLYLLSSCSWSILYDSRWTADVGITALQFCNHIWWKADMLLSQKDSSRTTIWYRTSMSVSLFGCSSEWRSVWYYPLNQWLLQTTTISYAKNKGYNEKMQELFPFYKNWSINDVLLFYSYQCKQRSDHYCNTIW